MERKISEYQLSQIHRRDFLKLTGYLIGYVVRGLFSYYLAWKINNYIERENRIQLPPLTNNLNLPTLDIYFERNPYSRLTDFDAIEEITAALLAVPSKIPLFFRLLSSIGLPEVSEAIVRTVSNHYGEDPELVRNLIHSNPFKATFRRFFLPHLGTIVENVNSIYINEVIETKDFVNWIILLNNSLPISLTVGKPNTRLYFMTPPDILPHTPDRFPLAVSPELLLPYLSERKVCAAVPIGAVIPPLISYYDVVYCSLPSQLQNYPPHLIPIIYGWANYAHPIKNPPNILLAHRDWSLSQKNQFSEFRNNDAEINIFGPDGKSWAHQSQWVYRNGTIKGRYFGKDYDATLNCIGCWTNKKEPKRPVIISGQIQDVYPNLQAFQTVIRALEEFLKTQLGEGTLTLGSVDTGASAGHYIKHGNEWSSRPTKLNSILHHTITGICVITTSN